MRRTLPHQIRQKIHMIVSQLRDGRLFFCVIGSFEDSVHPPLIAGSRAEHAAHQVVMSVCMSKGVQGVVAVYSEFFRRNENGSAGSQGNIASAISYGSGSHCGCRIISGAGRHFHNMRNSQFICNGRKHRSHSFIRFIDLCQLFLPHTADLTHLLRPAAVLYIKQKHAGCV